MKRLLILASITMIWSCEKPYDQTVDVQVDLGPNVICFLYNNKPFTEVRITETVPLGGNGNIYNTIRNATVEISDGSQNYILTGPGIGFNHYHIDSTQLKVRKGVTYSLNIHLSDGRYVHSVCTVPSDNIPLFNIQAADVNHDEYWYSISWNNDDPWEKFYCFKIETWSTILTDTAGNVIDTLYETLTVIPFKKLQDVTSVAFSKVEKFPTFTHGLNGRNRNHAYGTSSAVYKYYDSAIKNLTGNIYGEPSPVYTNIVNGLGIFGPMISK